MKIGVRWSEPTARLFTVPRPGSLILNTTPLDISIFRTTMSLFADLFFLSFFHEVAITRRVILHLSGHRATKPRASLTIRKTYLMLVGQKGSIVLLHSIF